MIPLHEEVLKGSASGYVWWGWWKKEHELSRDRALKQLKRLINRQGSLEIGLLNRKDDEFFRASVDDIFFEGKGKKSVAPDSRCPELYRDREPGCSAWLRMRSIERISKATYETKFGQVPTGDPTLYEVRTTKGDSSLSVYPPPSWDMTETAAPGDTILHLSDLHFGESHGFRQYLVTPAESVQRVSLLDRVLTAVNKAEADIGIVVASGDFVSKGTTDDYPAAADFLCELLDRLQLEKKHLVLVPGNHDFKTRVAMNSLPTMDYSHERPYRDFVSGLLGVTKEAEIERLQHFVLSSGEHVVFGSLNSVRLRGKETKEYGYVGLHRYAEMFDYMNQILAQTGTDAYRIAVLHHHVLPVQELESPRDGVPVSLTVDAAQLLDELQERRFDALLHGHQHKPFYSLVSRSIISGTSVKSPERRIAIIGNGSSGATNGALAEDFPYNTVGVYSVEAQKLHARWYFYNNILAPNKLHEWTVPREIFAQGLGPIS